MWSNTPKLEEDHRWERREKRLEAKRHAKEVAAKAAEEEAAKESEEKEKSSEEGQAEDAETPEGGEKAEVMIPSLRIVLMIGW